MQIRLETSLPVHKEDPESFTQPVVVSIYDYDELDQEFLIGRLLADHLYIGKAQQEGHNIYDIFDCDEWEQIYPILVDEYGEWRAELTYEESIDEVLVFYRLFLSPCTANARKEILDSVFDYFGCYTLIGMWDVLEIVSLPDLVDLGFAKLSGSPMVVKHNAHGCKFMRNKNGADFPRLEPTAGDQQWVEAEVERFEDRSQ
jgi:hypothetical protein